MENNNNLAFSAFTTPPLSPDLSHSPDPPSTSSPRTKTTKTKSTLPLPWSTHNSHQSTMSTTLSRKHSARIPQQPTIPSIFAPRSPAQVEEIDRHLRARVQRLTITDQQSSNPSPSPPSRHTRSDSFSPSHQRGDSYDSFAAAATTYSSSRSSASGSSFTTTTTKRDSDLSRMSRVSSSSSASSNASSSLAPTTTSSVSSSSSSSSLGPSPKITSLQTTNEAPLSPFANDVHLEIDRLVANLSHALSLSTVYLASMPIPTARNPEPELTIVSSRGLPSPTPSFDPLLHFSALRAPEGGLLFRRAQEEHDDDDEDDQLQAGVLIPVIEARRVGYLICGYTNEIGRVFTHDEVARFRKSAQELESWCTFLNKFAAERRDSPGSRR
ncbi:hypothetical protein T439DRAFT_300402 [Meredithblackwellia eburnea MCA 4105]